MVSDKVIGMITPVIHCLEWEQINENLKICARNDIERVWLIYHSTKPFAVMQLKYWFVESKLLYPQLKIGLNFLQLPTNESMAIGESLGVDGIWSDYDCSGIINRKRLLFGPVAFKYQKTVENDELENVCKEAMKNMDVITTSGPATGVPASIEKIKRIRSYIGNYPLAIASGINIDNKKQFEPLVDYMLVASSITNDNEVIIEDKLVKLIKS